MHSLDILEAFAQLKLEVPLTKSKVPPVLEEVRAKREYYLQRWGGAGPKGVLGGRCIMGVPGRKAALPRQVRVFPAKMGMLWAEGGGA